MARDPRRATKRKLAPDTKYNNVLVSKFIRKIMTSGKLSLSERVFYSAMEIVAKETKKDPLSVFEEALKNVCPTVQVKSRRIGGANYSVPMEVRGDRRYHFGMIWIRDAARARKGESFNKKLAKELIDAAAGVGAAVKKREDTHRMAEANKAFAHFARY